MDRMEYVTRILPGRCKLGHPIMEKWKGYFTKVIKLRKGTFVRVLSYTDNKSYMGKKYKMHTKFMYYEK